MYPEFLINCGPNTRGWLSKFYTDIQQSGALPPDFKKSKIIAIIFPSNLGNQKIAQKTTAQSSKYHSGETSRA